MNKLKFFAEADSSVGHVSYMADYLDTKKKIIILSNMTKRASVPVFGQIESYLSDKKASYKTVFTPGEENRICAIIKEDTLFINKDNLPFYVSGAVIDFSDCYGDFLESSIKDEVIKKENEEREKMFLHLSRAKKIHDDWEKIYIKNMDFDILGKKTEGLISDIFLRKPVKNQAGKNVRGFFGTMLPSGNINYIDDLTEGLKRRILIKGRPGTGKSTILKKIRKEALDRGYFTESYYCSFDPVSLDMLVIRELGIAVFDSTSPHEKAKEKEGDEIFDVYAIAVNHDTDTIFSSELSKIKSDYDEEIIKAKKYLKNAKDLSYEKEKVLSESLDYSRLQKTMRELYDFI